MNKNIDEEAIPQPIITDSSSSHYKNTKGIKFLTVGTGGNELSSPKATPGYLVIQDNNEYGFLKIELENNGKSLVGEFCTGNDDDILDNFELIKS